MFRERQQRLVCLLKQQKDTALEAVEAFIARFYHFENISQRGVRDEDDEDDDDDVEEEKEKKAAPKDEL